MKKFICFLIFVIIILAIISGIYLNYKIKINTAVKENKNYDYYYQKEISGSELAGIINRVVDNNEKNEIKKDENGVYINNNESSINIKIHITDNDTIYEEEKIYNSGISKFVENYGNIKFKCTEVKYHKNTKKVSDLFFEQVTE